MLRFVVRAILRFVARAILRLVVRAMLGFSRHSDRQIVRVMLRLVVRVMLRLVVRVTMRSSTPCFDDSLIQVSSPSYFKIAYTHSDIFHASNVTNCCTTYAQIHKKLGVLHPVQKA